LALIDRIGIDLGRKIRLEDGIALAARHGVRYIDIQLDTDDNALERFDAARAKPIRAALERHGIQLGLHTSSAVNVAEFAPHVADAVDRYLLGYLDAYRLLGASWIVIHAGYHFGADKGERMHAGRSRIRRIAAAAEQAGVMLYLENLNKEPEAAEVHYLAHTLEEWRYYYEAIDSPSLRLSFTANHAHLVPEGVDGFVDALDFGRVGEVRLADCFRNGHEVHLRPGEGDLDFARLFARVEAAGFGGHYTNAFGTLDDMLAARSRLVAIARAAGVGVD
jgi:sugar phosphate isomerase/epimerase